MNVILPEKEKMSKKRISIYVIIAIVCILAISIVIGIQVLGDDIINNLFGISKITNKTEQEEQQLKDHFEDLLDNKLDDKGNYITQKIEENKEIIYTNYQKEEKTENHEININLPYINIKDNAVEKFNKEISEIFKGKAEEVLSSTDENIIYRVKYKAYIENNILSLIIYSDLKQNTNPQRVIIQTFNFDLKENKKMDLEDIIKEYNLNEKDVQNKIDKDIEEEQRRLEDLKDIGYNMFSRDIKSNIYDVENISEYFIYNHNIYIIFAYGNEKITSEKDIVII